MAVIKLTSSKKAVQIIADDGTVYQTSVIFINNLLRSQSAGYIVKLSKLPEKVSQDRFEQSEVWGGNPIQEADKTSNDALSVKATQAKKETKEFEDKKIW